MIKCHRHDFLLDTFVPKDVPDIPRNALFAPPQESLVSPPPIEAIAFDGLERLPPGIGEEEVKVFVDRQGDVVNEVYLQVWNVSLLPVHGLLRLVAHSLLQISLREELRVDQLGDVSAVTLFIDSGFRLRRSPRAGQNWSL